MKLGIVTHFDAAHSLPKYEGKCRNVHGHTYTLEVIIEGEVDSETNFVIDYLELKKIIGDIINKFDHTYLNDLLAYPTCENIVIFIKEELTKVLSSKNPDIRLVSVKIWEGKGKWVMIDG